MSNENKGIAVNLYGIMDAELDRMHKLLHAYMAMPKEPMSYYTSHSASGPGGAGGAGGIHSGMGQIYQRIVTMQDLLLKSLITHDKELQERIAELALTGTADGTKT